MMISDSLIFAAMPDSRPGRFYSVDELAAALRVQDQAELRRRLQVMADTAGVHDSFRLVRGPSNEFYQRISVVPTLMFCGAVGWGDQLERLLAGGWGKSPTCGSGSPE
jgi:hypothetical protein